MPEIKILLCEGKEDSKCSDSHIRGQETIFFTAIYTDKYFYFYFSAFLHYLPSSLGDANGCRQCGKS